jgi:hypothetical protein
LFCALLFAFSTVAGDVASDLEDHAAGGVGIADAAAAGNLIVADVASARRPVE